MVASLKSPGAAAAAAGSDRATAASDAPAPANAESLSTSRRVSATDVSSAIFSPPELGTSPRDRNPSNATVQTRVKGSGSMASRIDGAGEGVFRRVYQGPARGKKAVASARDALAVALSRTGPCVRPIWFGKGGAINGNRDYQEARVRARIRLYRRRRRARLFLPSERRRQRFRPPARW